MAVAVITKASGGLPVIDVTATKPGLGVPVTEAVSGRGIAVTKVSLAVGGLPVTFVADSNYWPPAGGGTTYATLNGTPTNTTLSNGNLTATHTNTTDGGARSTTFKGNANNPGKYYFEVTLGATHGFADSVGVITAAGTYANIITGNGGIMALSGNSGIIFNNGINTSKTLGTWVSGDVIGVAFNITASGGSVWFRRNGGNWNGDPTANPATSVGAITVGVGSDVAPTITFGSTGSLANDTMTLNAGQGAFTQAVPAGFTSGWPV